MGQGEYRLSPGHLAGPESKVMLKQEEKEKEKVRRRVAGPRSRPEGAATQMMSVCESLLTRRLNK